MKTSAAELVLSIPFTVNGKKELPVGCLAYSLDTYLRMRHTPQMRSLLHWLQIEPEINTFHREI